ncbi:hypothetical protein B7R56_21880 [Pseudomonas savastanoi pv. retacarpa]|uniref:Lipoprotein n=3 Tax=Pseudomonas savastanoi TaxID=29438 RepID=A0A0Q0A0J9_PSESS|nr:MULTISPECIES: hypothetical protein [Pseudomonas]ARD10060.1 hypothetical protein PSA3335_02550 [Pseudomonas savastanoi pv. savastanoi NCPPB 3335]KAA3532622.1 hypothetical protein DXU85_28980 [Pseudomonas savastanoi]KPB12008.1 hypothetical protein AC519_4763 [Pseudomonas savastanoi]KPX97121.1 hypothetical protein ALO61_200191 [Pseudomonas savastanoi pv. nerii]KPY70639.1 hypothetical protein ALO58_00464 [Pseudomonas savastanoi pv. savastanoi]
MKKVFLFPLLVGAALLVAGCEKTSEDHVQDAGKHEETFLQKQAQGDKQQAADEKAKAEKDYSEANQARSTEDRHQPPSSDVPNYIKAPEKN